MKPLSIFVCALAVCSPLPVLANDTSAVLTTGGLQFVATQDKELDILIVNHREAEQE